MFFWIAVDIFVLNVPKMCPHAQKNDKKNMEDIKVSDYVFIYNL